jgi:hypothetical protein
MKELVARMEGLNPDLMNFIESLDLDLGRDPDSLEMFQWVVEDHYDEMLSEMLEYFKERPDMQAIQVETALTELNHMLEWFTEKEEYEKCMRLVEVRTGYETRFRESGILQ